MVSYLQQTTLKLTINLQYHICDLSAVQPLLLPGLLHCLSSFEEFTHGLRKYVSYYFLFIVLYRIANNAFNRLSIANALAINAKCLSTVNTVDLLPKVIKLLEEGLKQCHSLGKHTNVMHFTLTLSSSICRPIKNINLMDSQSPYSALSVEF